MSDMDGHALAAINSSINARFKLTPQGGDEGHTNFTVEFVDPVSMARYATFIGSDSDIEQVVQEERLRLEITLQLAMHREVVAKLEQLLVQVGGDAIPLPRKGDLAS